MTKIVIFGDSFAFDPGVNHAWTRQIAEHYDYTYLNLAQQGSSMHHAISRLMDYISEGPYSKDDFILFFMTSTKRSPWSPPNWSSSMMSYLAGKLPASHQSFQHYHENREFYEGYLDVYRPDVEQYHQLANYALLQTLPNRMLIMYGWEPLNQVRNMDVLKNTFSTTLSDSHGKVFVDHPIYEISMNEMSTKHRKQCEEKGWNDKRPNHFSIDNHTILAQQCINCIDADSNIFDPTAFKTNFFNPYS